MDKKEKFKTFLIIFILTGIYIFVFSESGFLERREFNKKYNALNEKIDYLKSSNIKLSHECEKYRSGIYSDNDIIGAGFVYKNGKLLYINDKDKEIIPDANGKIEDFTISIEHLRIIWILISIMFLFYYFLNKKKSEEITDGSDFN